jgi:hypothetical protein
MGVGQVSVAAATAVVGYDLLLSGTGPRFARMAGVDRVIKAVGVCGSAAGADTELHIFVEDVFAGNFYNITTGLPTKDHMVETKIVVPANAQIRVVVNDSAATNPINVTLTWDEYPAGSLR